MQADPLCQWLHLSKRASWDLSHNALTTAVLERRRQGLPLFDLVQSNPTKVGLLFDRERLPRVLANPRVLQYEPTPAGMLSCREAISRWYKQRGIQVDAHQMLLTASSSESYAHLLTLMCNPGDHILVPSPSYPLLDHLGHLQDVEIDRYPLIESDDWRIDVAALERAVCSSTRVIVVVSPNNPTGSVLHQQEREALEHVARKHHLAIVCDEVFAEFVDRPIEDRVVCAADGARVPTFSLGGLSKSALLPQLKLGWIVVGGPCVQTCVERLEMIADTYLSVNAPVQVAVEELLDGAASMRNKLMDRINENRAILRQVLGKTSAVTVLASDGGWYVCLRVPRVMEDEAWCEMLVRRHGVLVHPGAFYGAQSAGMLVVGLLAPPHEFAQAVRWLNEGVNEYVRAMPQQRPETEPATGT